MASEPVTRAEIRADIAELRVYLVEHFSTKAECQIMAAKLERLEEAALSPLKVRELVSEALRESEARGWTNRERMMGLALFVVTVASFLLNLLSVQGG